jgi:hypothetical protein
MHTQRITTKLYYVLTRDTRLDGYMALNEFLEDEYNAYIDDEEMIVFKEDKFYTLFQLTYSGYV